MNSALAAFAGADFHWTQGLRDIWAEQPYHVDGLNGDLADRIVAEFFARTRAAQANPIGQVLSGRAGSGKTHLIGALRRRVWEGGGWFVLIDIFGIADFWRTAALAFVESLTRRMPDGRTQAGAILLAALKKASADPDVRRAAAAKATSTLTKASAVDLMLGMLAASEPAETRRHQDVLRALVLVDSRDFVVSSFAGLWLQGQESDEARQRALGFLGGPPSPAEIVRGLLWIMGLAGPTLIAIDQIDAIVSEANAAGETAGRARTILQAVASGLTDLHDIKRRALTLVSCLEPTWAIFKQSTVASAADRFRELRALAPIGSPAIVERLIAGRLAPVYAAAGFRPRYPTFPFTRSAIESAVGLRPRAILMRCQEHQDACLAADEISDCATLAGAPSAAIVAAPAAIGAEALDEALAQARQRAAPDLKDEAAVAALLVVACELYLRQLKLPDSIDGEASAEPYAQNPALHAHLVFVFHDENDRQRRFGFRVLAQDNAIAFQARLRAAITASGLDAGLKGRRLIVLRDGAPPSGAKTAELVQGFVEAGGLFLAPAAPDFALFAALHELSRSAGFEAWLRRRKPLFEAELFQAAGLAPPDFLAAEPPPDVEVAPPPKSAPREPAPATPAPPLALPPAPASSGPREIYIGRAVQLGELAGPVTLSAALLPRHIAILAGSGAGKSVLLSRIVEEAALIGVPSLVLDVNNDLARLGEPWPSRPPEFSDDDALKAQRYFERVETVVWTPGVNAGRPMSLPLLPDFKALGRGSDPDSLDERERAVEMALATLEPHLHGGGAKAIKLRGALADALRVFARAGGGAFDDLLRLLSDLPENASRIADAPKLARDIADQLVAAIAANPLLRPEAEPLDPERLFSSESGRTRISVVNLAGLGSDAARASFVNQLQMTLFSWIKRCPSATGRLYALDEAQTYAPAKETTPAKRSALALVKQARKYGLGMIFATQEPRGIDHAIVSNCLTHVYGRLGSPASLEAVREMMAAKGGAADDVGRLKTGEFYFSTEGLTRPIKLRAPLCLSLRTQNPPTAEEVAAIARAGRDAVKSR
jgi:hypothetical protein